jgi:hypothetical protein
MLPACSCRQPCPKHLRATNSEVRTEIPGRGKLPRLAGWQRWQPALPESATGAALIGAFLQADR